VASCSRPSTAENDDDASSALTTPPASPSQLPSSPAVANAGAPEAEDIEKENAIEDEKVVEPPVNGLEIDANSESKELVEPRPYINPEVKFDYYDQTEPQEGSDADQNPPEPSKEFPFPKVSEVEVFEKYLENAEDMAYDELYRRTAVVSESLVAYQAEWDAIDKEIYEHESYLKAEDKRAEEETRAMMEENRIKDDAERDEVAKKFKDQLKLNGKKWQEFIAVNEKSIPNNTIRHLQNLRNPQFMAAARKKQQTAINRGKRLLNAPWPEVKKTKEDLEWEKRQKGRYMDPVKFDDMKQADVYGFEYSAHVKHYGQQPMAVVARQVNSNSNPTSNPTGDDANANDNTNEASRNRASRKATRKVYEADASATPEDSEEDGKLPLKRSRKPKIFIDGVETSERSMGQSRSGTPAVRTFASGKRVGRPPAKSKLQAVQLAQPSETPEVASGSDILNADGLIGGAALKHRELASSQEAQLHDAAESLVYQTQTDKIAAALPVKKKHAGGRPRKIRPEIIADGTQVAAPEAPQPKRKHAGGRPRKHPIPVDAEFENVVDQEPRALKSQPKKRRGRVKKETIHDDDLIQLGEENVLQSTEQDDGSQYTSTNTTRPTTSDSNATVSTFGSRRSARPATRDKTNAREARASANRRGSTAVHESSSLPASGRSKRKRASSDTDPSPIVVEPIQVADLHTKKRRARAKQDPDDAIEALPEAVGEASIGRLNKRKRNNTINESIAVADPNLFAPINFAPPPKKRRRAIKVEEKAEPEVEDVDSDADIDEDSLDPIAREALRKKRVKKEKSRKLSKNMKERWARGGMKEAQETRKANNALKRAHKQQTLVNQAAGLPPPPPPVLYRTAPNSGQVSAPPAHPEPKAEQEIDSEALQETPIETPATVTPTFAPVATKRKRTKSKSKPILPKRPASTRARKPSRMAMGLDGADDDEDDEEEEEEEDDDDLEQQFVSEYDHFQALSSPKKPIVLGKRVRKSLVDLSQLMDSEEDEEF
jgi:hypothetical protein